jgi:hypothetical protein
LGLAPFLARPDIEERPAISLLANENVLGQLGEGTLTLTTHRVRYSAQGLGNGEVTSIMLEEIASCALTSRSKPFLLVLAVLCFFFGLVGILLTNGGGKSVAGGLILGAALVVAYFATAQQVLELASAGATIRLKTTGTDRRVFEKFIDAVDSAKDARYLLVLKPQRNPEGGSAGG